MRLRLQCPRVDIVIFLQTQRGVCMGQNIDTFNHIDAAIDSTIHVRLYMYTYTCTVHVRLSMSY